MNYQITFDRPEYDDLMKLTLFEKDQDIVSYFNGNFMEMFLNKIRNREKEADLKCNKSRIYSESKRKTTNYISLHASCKICNSSYKIWLKHKPVEDQDFVVFNVESAVHGDHEENVKIKQIRSGNRTKLAKQIILEANGSTTSFLEKQAAEGKIYFKKFKNIILNSKKSQFQVILNIVKTL